MSEQKISCKTCSNCKEDKKLKSSLNGTKPLVAGHRDTTVIRPLSQLQKRIDEMEEIVNKNFDAINQNRFMDYRNLMMNFQGLDQEIEDVKLSVEALLEVLKVNPEEFQTTKIKIKKELEEKRQAEEDILQKRKVVDRSSTGNDIIRFDFVGMIDGKEFPGGNANDYNLDLSSNTFIPGFAEQLVDVKSGDIKEVKVTFPTTYHAKNLAGKEAVFKCTIKSVKEKITSK